MAYEDLIPASTHEIEQAQYIRDTASLYNSDAYKEIVGNLNNKTKFLNDNKYKINIYGDGIFGDGDSGVIDGLGKFRVLGVDTPESYEDYFNPDLTGKSGNALNAQIEALTRQYKADGLDPRNPEHLKKIVAHKKLRFEEAYNTFFNDRTKLNYQVVGTDEFDRSLLKITHSELGDYGNYLNKMGAGTLEYVTEEQIVEEFGAHSIGNNLYKVGSESETYTYEELEERRNRLFGGKVDPYYYENKASGLFFNSVKKLGANITAETTAVGSAFVILFSNDKELINSWANDAIEAKKDASLIGGKNISYSTEGGITSDLIVSLLPEVIYSISSFFASGAGAGYLLKKGVKTYALKQLENRLAVKHAQKIFKDKFPKGAIPSKEAIEKLVVDIATNKAKYGIVSGAGFAINYPRLYGEQWGSLLFEQNLPSNKGKNLLTRTNVFKIVGTAGLATLADTALPFYLFNKVVPKGSFAHNDATKFINSVSDRVQKALTTKYTPIQLIRLTGNTATASQIEGFTEVFQDMIKEAILSDISERKYSAPFTELLDAYVAGSLSGGISSTIALPSAFVGDVGNVIREFGLQKKDSEATNAEDIQSTPGIPGITLETDVNGRNLNEGTVNIYMGDSVVPVKIVDAVEALDKLKKTEPTKESAKAVAGILAPILLESEKASNKLDIPSLQKLIDAYTKIDNPEVKEAFIEAYNKIINNTVNDKYIPNPTAKHTAERKNVEDKIKKFNKSKGGDNPTTPSEIVKKIKSNVESNVEYITKFLKKHEASKEFTDGVKDFFLSFIKPGSNNKIEINKDFESKLGNSRFINTLMDLAIGRTTDKVDENINKESWLQHLFNIVVTGSDNKHLITLYNSNKNRLATVKKAYNTYKKTGKPQFVYQKTKNYINKVGESIIAEYGIVGTYEEAKDAQKKSEISIVEFSSNKESTSIITSLEEQLNIFENKVLPIYGAILESLKLDNSNINFGRFNLTSNPKITEPKISRKEKTKEAYEYGKRTYKDTEALEKINKLFKDKKLTKQEHNSFLKGRKEAITKHNNNVKKKRKSISDDKKAKELTKEEKKSKEEIDSFEELKDKNITYVSIIFSLFENGGHNFTKLIKSLENFKFPNKVEKLELVILFNAFKNGLYVEILPTKTLQKLKDYLSKYTNIKSDTGEYPAKNFIKFLNKELRFRKINKEQKEAYDIFLSNGDTTTPYFKELENIYGNTPFGLKLKEKYKKETTSQIKRIEKQIKNYLIRISITTDKPQNARYREFIKNLNKDIDYIKSLENEPNSKPEVDNTTTKPLKITKDYQNLQDLQDSQVDTKEESEEVIEKEVESKSESLVEPTKEVAENLYFGLRKEVDEDYANLQSIIEKTFFTKNTIPENIEDITNNIKEKLKLLITKIESSETVDPILNAVINKNAKGTRYVVSSGFLQLISSLDDKTFNTKFIESEKVILDTQLNKYSIEKLRNNIKFNIPNSDISNLAKELQELVDANDSNLPSQEIILDLVAKHFKDKVDKLKADLPEGSPKNLNNYFSQGLSIFLTKYIITYYDNYKANRPLGRISKIFDTIDGKKVNVGIPLTQALAYYKFLAENMNDGFNHNNNDVLRAISKQDFGGELGLNKFALADIGKYQNFIKDEILKNINSILFLSEKKSKETNKFFRTNFLTPSFLLGNEMAIDTFAIGTKVFNNIAITSLNNTKEDTSNLKHNQLLVVVNNTDENKSTKSFLQLNTPLFDILVKKGNTLLTNLYSLNYVNDSSTNTLKTLIGDNFKEYGTSLGVLDKPKESKDYYQNKMMKEGYKTRERITAIFSHFGKGIQLEIAKSDYTSEREVKKVIKESHPFLAESIRAGFDSSVNNIKNFFEVFRHRKGLAYFDSNFTSSLRLFQKGTVAPITNKVTRAMVSTSTDTAFDISDTKQDNYVEKFSGLMAGIAQGLGIPVEKISNEDYIVALNNIFSDKHLIDLAIKSYNVARLSVKGYNIEGYDTQKLLAKAAKEMNLAYKVFKDNNTNNLKLGLNSMAVLDVIAQIALAKSSKKRVKIDSSILLESDGKSNNQANGILGYYAFEPNQERILAIDELLTFGNQVGLFLPKNNDLSNLIANKEIEDSYIDNGRAIIDKLNSDSTNSTPIFNVLIKLGFIKGIASTPNPLTGGTTFFITNELHFRSTFKYIILVNNYLGKDTIFDNLLADMYKKSLYTELRNNLEVRKALTDPSLPADFIQAMRIIISLKPKEYGKNKFAQRLIKNALNEEIGDSVLSALESNNIPSIAKNRASIAAVSTFLGYISSRVLDKVAPLSKDKLSIENRLANFKNLAFKVTIQRDSVYAIRDIGNFQYLSTLLTSESIQKSPYSVAKLKKDSIDQVENSLPSTKDFGRKVVQGGIGISVNSTIGLEAQALRVLANTITQFTSSYDAISSLAHNSTATIKRLNESFIKVGLSVNFHKDALNNLESIKKLIESSNSDINFDSIITEAYNLLLQDYVNDKFKGRMPNIIGEFIGESELGSSKNMYETLLEYLDIKITNREQGIELMKEVLEETKVNQYFTAKEISPSDIKLSGYDITKDSTDVEVSKALTKLRRLKPKQETKDATKAMDTILDNDRESTRRDMEREPDLDEEVQLELNKPLKEVFGAVRESLLKEIEGTKQYDFYAFLLNSMGEVLSKIPNITYKEYLTNSKSRGTYNISSRTISIFNGRVDTDTQHSPVQIFTHEFSHVFFENLLNSSSRFRFKKVVAGFYHQVYSQITKDIKGYTWFMANPNSKNKLEIAEAKLQYESLFGDNVISPNRLEEFLVTLTTNYHLNNKVSELNIDTKFLNLQLNSLGVAKDSKTNILRKIIIYGNYIIKTIVEALGFERTAGLRKAIGSSDTIKANELISNLMEVAIRDTVLEQVRITKRRKKGYNEKVSQRITKNINSYLFNFYTPKNLFNIEESDSIIPLNSKGIPLIYANDAKATKDYKARAVSIEYSKFYDRMSKYFRSKTSWYAQIVSRATVGNLDFKWIRTINHFKQLIEANSINLKETFSNNIKLYFDFSHITNEENEFIVNSVFRTDIFNLLQSGNYDKLHKILSRTNAQLETDYKKEFNRLFKVLVPLNTSKSDLNNFKELVETQIRILSDYMVKNTTKSKQAIGIENVHILNKLLLEEGFKRKVLHNTDYNPTVLKSLKRLSTIQSLLLIDESQRKSTYSYFKEGQSLTKLGKENLNAFTLLTHTLINNKKEAEKYASSLFSIKAGYVGTDKTGLNKEYKIFHLKDTKRLKTESYELVTDDLPGVFKGYGLFESKYYVENKQKLALLSLNTLGTETSINIDSFVLNSFEENPNEAVLSNNYNQELLNSEENRLSKNKILNKIVDYKLEQTYPEQLEYPVHSQVPQYASYEGMLTPINVTLNTRYDIKSKLYNDKSKFIDTLVKTVYKNSKISLGGMHSTAIIKVLQNEHKNTMAILKDKGKLPLGAVNLFDEKILHKYNFYELPKTIRNNLYASAEQTDTGPLLYVPLNILNDIFAYDLVSVKNTKIFSGLSNKNKVIIQSVFDTYTDFVSFLKLDIIIKNFAVPLNNLMASIVAIATNGNITETLDSLLGVTTQILEYEVNEANLAKAKTAYSIAVDRKDIKKQAFLKNKINILQTFADTSPAKEYVDKVFNTTISTLGDGVDVTTMSDAYVNAAITRGINKLPKSIQKLLGELWFAKGSVGYENLRDLVRLTDYTSKATMYKLAIDRGVSEQEAIYSAVTTFIYFDSNLPSNLEILDRSGITLFFKFYLASKMAFLRLFYKNPVSYTSFFALEDMLGINISDISDLSISPTNAWDHLHRLGEIPALRGLNTIID